MAEIDIAAIYQLVGTVASDVREMKANMATKAELIDMKTELKRDMMNLREALTEYHSSVLGHGILISDLDERLRRIERQLGITPEH